jgi:hypothetical protein
VRESSSSTPAGRMPLVRPEQKATSMQIAVSVFSSCKLITVFSALRPHTDTDAQCSGENANMPTYRTRFPPAS